jgi:hypothetical protein
MNINAHRGNPLFNNSVNGSASTSATTGISATSALASSAKAQHDDHEASFRAALHALDRYKGDSAGAAPTVAAPAVAPTTTSKAKSIATVDAALGSDLLSAQHEARTSLGAPVSVKPELAGMKPAAMQAAATTKPARHDGDASTQQANVDPPKPTFGVDAATGARYFNLPSGNDNMPGSDQYNGYGSNDAFQAATLEAVKHWQADLAAWGAAMQAIAQTREAAA